MEADYYQKTVVMPTYLLAFIVCDFRYLQAVAGKSNQTSVSIYVQYSYKCCNLNVLRLQITWV